MLGPLIASGREADVYEFGAGKVLRRYRREADVTGEADAMRYLAGRGYPVPEVFEAAGADLVMERLTGPTMAQSLVAGELSIAEGGGLLADLHRRLHDIQPEPGVSMIHLDLHPDNILLTERGPVVIDWCNVRLGDGDFDLALTALILAEVSLWDHPFAAGAGELLEAFKARAPGDPRRLLDDAVALRSGQTNTLTAGEIALLGTAANLVRL
ncbi:phosphotransferase [Symbioplanes lichenis]|uniref:phosphotransferase n=1 Tax=Symbioplanes lichenis TaxID=1629072 RepID=UPI002739D870|nr:phosphotransferase [Actinoplanes lichenis]